MTTTSVSVRRIALAARERQVLEGIAQGMSVDEVAATLGIGSGTASGYLKSAKVRLHGVRDAPAAVAVAYATGALAAPALRSPEADVPIEQRDLIPLIARGLGQRQMAVTLRRDIDDIRRDGRDLRANLKARTLAHLVTLAWQAQLLTADQVKEWLRPAAPTTPAAHYRERTRAA